MKRLKQAITFYLLCLWLCLIALMPYWLLYKLSDLCFYVVYYIVRYRRKIVYRNLVHAFPGKSQAELRKLEKAFYKHFCDLLLEYIKSLTITQSQITQRCVIKNLELLQNLYAAGRHVMLVTGHLGNWEWAANAVAIHTNYKLHILYKPLSNPYFDTLVGRIRKRFNKTIIPDSQALRKMLAYGSVPTATAILADQAPAVQYAYKMNFLNQPTYVWQGVEKLARKLNHTVIYVHIRKRKRGYYELELELLFENPIEAPPYVITQTYMQTLEKNIQLQPDIWLWSHNRWKDRYI